jgi:hypothetical protein
MSILNKRRVEQAVGDAFLPLSVVLDYPDGYLGSGDRVGFTVFEEDRAVYQSPYWAFSLAGAEAWIETARLRVISRGFKLDEWRKPAWMSELLRPE